jgi:hypothetical protein
MMMANRQKGYYALFLTALQRKKSPAMPGKRENNKFQIFLIASQVQCATHQNNQFDSVTPHPPCGHLLPMSGEKEK